VTPPVVEVAGLTKDYRGLRPLRLQELEVRADESVAIVGFDRASAEVFANLLTGATLPDTGEVRVFGRPTSEIADSADWIATVDRFGLVTERAVLLDALTVLQNLAMPFSLDIEPPAPEILERAEALAAEVRLPQALWTAPVADLDAEGRTRVRLARAIAIDPAVLLLEHASAGVPAQAAVALAADVRALARRRHMASIAATADETFARAVADRVVRLEPSTGRLVERKRWFGLG
jgi:rhamnose transport system ATP-binding protein